MLAMSVPPVPAPSTTIFFIETSSFSDYVATRLPGNAENTDCKRSLRNGRKRTGDRVPEAFCASLKRDVTLLSLPD